MATLCVPTTPVAVNFCARCFCTTSNTPSVQWVCVDDGGQEWICSACHAGRPPTPRTPLVSDSENETPKKTKRALDIDDQRKEIEFESTIARHFNLDDKKTTDRLFRIIDMARSCRQRIYAEEPRDKWVCIVLFSERTQDEDASVYYYEIHLKKSSFDLLVNKDPKARFIEVLQKIAKNETSCPETWDRLTLVTWFNNYSSDVKEGNIVVLPDHLKDLDGFFVFVDE